MPEGRGVGGLGDKRDGIRKYNRQVKNSHRDAKDSTGNVVMVIAVCGARRAPELPGASLCKACDCLAPMLCA